MGHYLDAEPGHLQFEYGPHGRPSVVQPLRGKSLCFNLSYSDGIALYAVTWDRAVGVDIERFRFLAEADRIANRCVEVKCYSPEKGSSG